METLMVDRVHNSLRLFMHRNAVFLCERLCAQFPTEVYRRRRRRRPSSFSTWLVRLDLAWLLVGMVQCGVDRECSRCEAAIGARGLTCGAPI
jgi:hypothetical protein